MSEEKEVIAEQPEQIEVAQSQEEAKEIAISQSEAPKRDVEHNWAEANKVLKMQKSMIDDLQLQIQELKKPKIQEEPDEFDQLDPEDYLQVGKARQLAEKVAEKKAQEAAKKIVQEYMQQQTIESDEQKAREKFEDYDYVMENYAIPMIKNDPALAYRIQQSKNPAMTAYKLGKLSDDYQEATMKQQVSPKAEKILKNSSRPVSVNAAGSSLKSQADQFSKMKPNEVWELSQKYARGA